MTTDDFTVHTEDADFGNGWRVVVTVPDQGTFTLNPDDADNLADELHGAATHPGYCECGKPAIRGKRCGACQDEHDAHVEAARARLTTKDWHDYSMGGATDPMSGRLA